jgi:hypothetical protein
MWVRVLWRGAIFALTCSGLLTPAQAERPAEKTLWLTLPISIRSASEQGQMVVRWYIYFGKDGTAYLTDEKSGAEHGAVLPPNQDSISKSRGNDGTQMAVQMTGPLSQYYVRALIHQPAQDTVVAWYLNITDTSCTVLRSEFSVRPGPSRPPVSTASGTPGCQLFQGRHLDH